MLYNLSSLVVSLISLAGIHHDFMAYKILFLTGIISIVSDNLEYWCDIGLLLATLCSFNELAHQYHILARIMIYSLFLFVLTHRGYIVFAPYFIFLILCCAPGYLRMMCKSRSSHIDMGHAMNRRFIILGIFSITISNCIYIVYKISCFICIMRTQSCNEINLSVGHSLSKVLLVYGMHCVWSTVIFNKNQHNYRYGLLYDWFPMLDEKHLKE